MIKKFLCKDSVQREHSLWNQFQSDYSKENLISDCERKKKSMVVFFQIFYFKYDLKAILGNKNLFIILMLQERLSDPRKIYSNRSILLDWHKRRMLSMYMPDNFGNNNSLVKPPFTEIGKAVNIGGLYFLKKFEFNKIMT